MIVSPVDVPVAVALGVVVGYLYGRVLYAHNEDWFVFSYALVAVLWLHLGAVWVAGIPPWGLASAVTTDSRLLAVVYPLSYPLWYRAGAEAAFLAFGRRPQQGGSLWLYRVEDDTEEFDPAWDS